VKEQGVNFTNILRAVFRTKVFFEAIFCVQFVFIIFWELNNGEKVVNKLMLVKLTQEQCIGKVEKPD